MLTYDTCARTKLISEEDYDDDDDDDVEGDNDAAVVSSCEVGEITAALLLSAGTMIIVMLEIAATFRK